MSSYAPNYYDVTSLPVATTSQLPPPPHLYITMFLHAGILRPRFVNFYKQSRPLGFQILFSSSREIKKSTVRVCWVHTQSSTMGEREMDTKGENKELENKMEQEKARAGAIEASQDLGERYVESSHDEDMSKTKTKQGTGDSKEGKVIELQSHNRQGQLLSTPSRLLKLIIPLPEFVSDDTNNKGIEKEDEKEEGKDTAKATNPPLAILTHPHQPLSYLERLLQSSLPRRTPSSPLRTITFLASTPTTPTTPSSASAPSTPTTSPSSLPNLARFSPATEIGDFLRDASKHGYFLLQISGLPTPIRVSVPSFSDRTFFLRQRLRTLSAQIATDGDLKASCDALARRGAQRVAITGFVGLISWWGAVTWATFWTPLGWDVMEPVTYLVGLSGVISGYLWFLYHNREVSYRSVLHLTVSRRQMRLYEERGFDLERWHELLEEGKAVRREIRAVAEEYGVQWDERGDEGMEGDVKKALDEHEEKEGRRAKCREEEEEEEDEVEEMQEERKK